MTLTSTIITAAYRESNFVGQNAVLTEDEQNEALALLQGLVLSFHGLVTGTKLQPWHVPTPMKTASTAANYPVTGNLRMPGTRDISYPPSNSRVFLRNTAAQAINFQYEPEDGALMEVVDAGFTADVTLIANGMFFGPSGVTEEVTLTPSFGGGSRVPRRTYLYRAELAAWMQLEDLDYDAEFQFPVEFDDWFVCALAMRLAPRFGNEPKQITMLRFKEMTVFCRGWYRQSGLAIGNGPELAHQSFRDQSYFGDPNTGRS